jgi:ATP adenylyltransferase
MIVKHLWSPWRLEYIKGQRLESDCPFCSLPAEDKDPENLILFKDQDIFVVLNKFPYNPGHLMVIPRAHVKDLSELDAQVQTKLMGALPICIDKLRQALEPQGFNVGMNIGQQAGAGIPHHLHWHVIPRWGGDTNFMPLIADTKTVPTHNASIFAQLSKHFAKFWVK